jgi:hypothetical protein
LEEFPKLEDSKRETLWSLYGHICSSWETLVDIRFKLLGLVPSVSILLLLELTKLSATSMKLFGSSIGFIFTLAIWLYEKRNSELHDDLVSRARKIESELGIETGQFLGRKINTYFFIKHDIALNIIYFTSMITWLVFMCANFNLICCL